jgi:hypothetical protein
MTDDVFNSAFHVRNQFPVTGSRKWCFCGEEMDSVGWHPHACKDVGKRAPVRNGLQKVFLNPAIKISDDEKKKEKKVKLMS